MPSLSPRVPLWLPLAANEATLETVGGKGASLARLAGAGLPVPDGFVLTTAAYRRVVEAGDLQSQILAAAHNADAGAERTIRGLFTSVAIPDDVLNAISVGYASLGAEAPAVAVRSSATAEDLPGLSFAGQQDTFLNVRGEHDLVEAIRRCWGSLWTTRAISYRQRAGIAAEEVSLAVVVQLLVPADASGVLFTMDPVSGARDQMTINATWGLGESLVGGQVTPDSLVVDRPSGAIVRQSVGDKSVMTVATASGTRDEPVPPERRQQAVLTSESARELAQMGQRIEALYGRPMDVEWALQRGRIAILQARPITSFAATTSEGWNDSLGHDFLWTSANLGEAVPDVMTPATWSLFQRFIFGAMQANFTAGFSPVGIIGGRLYMNLSLTATQASIIFMPRKTLVGLLEQAFGHISEAVEIPRIPIARWTVMRDLIPAGVRLQTRVRRNLQRFDAVVNSIPGRVEAVLRHIEAVSTPEQLRLVWFAELAPLLDDASAMLEAATRRDSGALLRARRSVSKLVGESDADLLVSGAPTSTGGNLASLEPLLGLERVARGELSREEYARRYGHRGPHEFEVSMPRPAEDPDWIDRQLEGLRAAPMDVSGLLGRRRAAAAAAWNTLAERHPKELDRVRKEVERARWGFRAREAARSEVVRVFWPLRTFYVRAGALLGRSDQVFFLSSDELLRVLGGDATPLASVARRQAAYARYAALPPYPVLIRGPFDPFAWAADPNRRTDVYDAHASPSAAMAAAAAAGDVLVGFPGAPGNVEGLARVLSSPEEGGALEPGEILVTTVTNVGWTPIFPRAAAIVTDVGAPLSHAAIVARELGIPAVVGTGTATQRIRSGQRIRVDGAAGTVTLGR